MKAWGISNKHPQAIFLWRNNQSTDSTGGLIVYECRLENGPECAQNFHLTLNVL